MSWKRWGLVVGVVCFVVMTLYVGMKVRQSAMHGKQILFEIEFANPWSKYDFSGVYIDDEGNVVNYHHHASPRSRLRPDFPLYTTQDLFATYGYSGRVVEALDSVTVQEMMQRIQPASLGVLETIEETQCFDAGAVIYYAYLYDMEEQTYAPVTLYVDGGDCIVRENATEAAQTLYRQLAEIWEAAKD